MDVNELEHGLNEEFDMLSYTLDDSITIDELTKSGTLIHAKTGLPVSRTVAMQQVLQDLDESITCILKLRNRLEELGYDATSTIAQRYCGSLLNPGLRVPPEHLPDVRRRLGLTHLPLTTYEEEGEEEQEF